MDLGKKLCTPKDIMLEELSLLSNRGSRLFKIRQQRSEKYTYETQTPQTTQTTLTHADALESILPSEDVNDGENPPNPECITPGPRSYQSPWEQAIISDPSLAASLTLTIPEATPPAPDYKSFNRVATPFGGFGEVTFQLAVVDLPLPQAPQAPLPPPGPARPDFNRTAMGWICDGTPLILPTVPFQSPDIPESDDL